SIKISVNGDVKGFEGGRVSFRCSHKLAKQDNKYLCRDPCTRTEDILVTVKSGGRAESERITLVDTADGLFTVTFRQLQMSDSGRYWCGVARPGFDTYAALTLIVKKGNSIFSSRHSPFTTRVQVSATLCLNSTRYQRVTILVV
uniref:Immunoglobulin domain-containing protein n=1 Tax=Scophthalmus maximus TaxID=52904 RepID=A0A8D2ZME7_SCOMX